MIKDFIGMLYILTSDEQKRYYEQVLKDLQSVEVKSMHDILLDEEIEDILECVQPEIKQCYKNATLLAMYYDCFDYCEGFVNVNGMAINHAWNKFTNPETGEVSYIDMTFEKTLDEDVTKYEYAVIGTYNRNELWEVMKQSNVYGSIYEILLFLRWDKEKNAKKNKKITQKTKK